MNKKHECDFKNPKRLGRAHYVCPECNRDISLDLVMIHLANEETEEMIESKKKGVQYMR